MPLWADDRKEIVMYDGSVTIDTKLDNSGISKGLERIKGLASTAMKGVSVAIGSATTALAGLSVWAVKSYADLEQNVGCIE